MQNPPAFPTLAVTWFSLRAQASASSIDWHNLGYTLLQLRLGQWHPAVRLARWFERRDARRADANLCVSRGLAAFLESRFGVTQAQVLYDRPGVGVHADRSRRARALPPGAVRPARHPHHHRRLHRLPDELDRRRRLRRRHRSGDAPRRADPRLGSGQQRAPFSRAGDSGDRRRRAPRRVRAPLRRPAGAAHPAARALSRAGGLSARRRQRRPRPVPAPLLVRARHPDEDRRSVRRRRAGLRAGLRRLPRRAGAPRRQRPAVFERPPARRHPVRSVRSVSRRIRRRWSACGPARASSRGRPGKRAGRAKREPVLLPQ